MRFDLTVELPAPTPDDDDAVREVEVVVEFTPGRPARLYGRPEDCYEGDPDEVEVISPADLVLSEYDLDNFIEKAREMYDAAQEDDR